MSFELPPLPYDHAALEPYVSAETLKFHHGKHHKTYIEKLNELIEDTEFAHLSLESIVVKSKEVDKKIFNNAAQAWNHTFLWNSMSPKRPKIPKEKKKKITENFSSLDKFQDRFLTAGKELFGSGWIWLTRSKDGALHIRALKNAGTPLTLAEVPLLTCDVWEHAYYLDVQNERAKYLKQFWEVANWEFAEANLLQEPIATMSAQKTRTSSSKESATRPRH